MRLTRASRLRRKKRVDRQTEQRITAQGLDLKDQVISINRVTKVVRGQNLSLPAPGRRWAMRVVSGLWVPARRVKVSAGNQDGCRGREEKNLIRVPLID